MLALVEARSLIRETLAASLETLTDFRIAAVQSVEELRGLGEQPSVVVLSASEGQSECKLASQLRHVGAIGLFSTPIIVLSGEDDLQRVAHALECGAQGYITTSMALDVAVAVIRLVAAGGTFAPAGTLMDAARPRADGAAVTKGDDVNFFTERQAAVIEALRRGMGNKMIACELNLRESTVKVHVRKIMRKLNATNRTQAAFLAGQLRHSSKA